ncbi:ABC transporter substrate-binding protein [Maledivibacter halophilus]|uniref:Peptide/nickel transport system substrate-binding protein n=1 Tax=Maledivibacter halophilus TaxID=36842 RepID=A0A1T5ID30_9FIRM|nr:ABC transporter substrate-binding protein [Maledivibacter halophilus]SKC36958.1 peptide/nickel transport system substrate-binding protein [Maledivibacter halophilus]
MGKKTLCVLMILVLVIGLFSGCGTKEESSIEGSEKQETTNEANTEEPVAKENKDEIKIALHTDIVSLDPQGHNDTTSETVSFLLFNRLFKLNTDFEAVPDLVEEYSQPSDKEWVLKIKEGVKFHDGVEMTSEDVKFSLERSKKSPTVQHVLAEIEKVEIVDKYTVKVTTKMPFAPFIYTLVHAGSSILPKHYVESEDKWNNPIGSGQYKFVEWISGDKIVLERNEDYYDKDNMGMSKKIVFRVIPEDTSRTIALETGEVDIVDTLSGLDAPRVKENPDLDLYEKPSTTIAYAGMNVEKPPFDNVLVRRAMNYAVDKEAIIEVALNGAGVEAKSVTAEALLGYKANDEYTYDPEKAKELLKEAGYDGDLEIEIWASGDIRKKTAEVIQANLMEIGVTASIEMFEWGAYLEATNSGKQGMFVLGWTSNPDPDATLTPQFSKESIGAQNRSRYVSDKVEQLLLDGRAELNTERRKEIYNELHETVMNDGPWVPLYVSNKVLGANSKLQGVELSPQGLWNLHKLHYK